MQNITLENHLLNAMGDMTKDRYKPVLSNLEISLNEKLGFNGESFPINNLAKRTIALYGGIYNSLRSKLTQTRKQQKNTLNNTNNFFRIYMNYVASNGTSQLIGTERRQKQHNDYKYWKININQNKTDEIALNSIISPIYDVLKKSNSLSNAKSNITNYLEDVEDYCIEKMSSQLFSELFQQYKEVNIIGKNFHVLGISEREIQRDLDEKIHQTLAKNIHQKKLEELILNPIQKQQIIGNESGLLTIETEIPCLMHYDSSNMQNPFEGFNQYILFSGEKGTGKTMTARYAMTLAKNISEKHGKEICLAKMNFEDRYQCGPLENIRAQFSQINQGDKIYVIFIDEIDTKIPSRNNGLGDNYKKDVVGEFLKFRGGGDYINKGNYMFIATTNQPNNIDPAILNVFKVETLQGPITKRQKTQILYNNLIEGMEIGYVQIQNWKEISEYLDNYHLNGRDLANIAKDANQKYRRIASLVPFESSIEETRYNIKKMLSKTNCITTENDIINSIKNYALREEMIKKSYL